jgi:hypothetical protein
MKCEFDDGRLPSSLSPDSVATILNILVKGVRNKDRSKMMTTIILAFLLQFILFFQNEMEAEATTSLFKRTVVDKLS